MDIMDRANLPIGGTLFGAATRAPAWLARLVESPMLAPGLVFTIAVLIYRRALAGSFVLDDLRLIMENPFVQNSHLWSHIFTGALGSFQSADVWANFYRPLTVFSFWLIYRFAGPNPFAFHLALVLLFAATAVVVLKVAEALIPNRTAALGGTLLWVVHPLRVEAVAWLSGWFDVGAGFFYLLAFLLFLRVEQGGSSRFKGHLLAALVYLPALFNKEMALSFPLLVLLYWITAASTGRWRRRIICLLPYLGAAAAYLIVRRLALGHLVRGADPLRVTTAVLQAAVALSGAHTRLFFWPNHLNVFRTFQISRQLHSPWPWWAMAIVAGALLLRRRSPGFSFLVLWWPVTLLPCLDIRQLSSPLIADRFSFIPSVGLSLASAWAAFALSDFLVRHRIPLRPVVSLVFAAILLAGAVRSTQAIAPWLSNEALLRYSRSQSPDNASLHLVQGWEQEYRYGDFHAAQAEFRAALRLSRAGPVPAQSITYEAYLGLGNLAQARGKANEAVNYYQTAERFMPSLPEAYQMLGAVYFPQHDYAQAAGYFQQAVERSPLDLGARFYLGTCLEKLGEYRAAVAQFGKACQIDPTYAQACAAARQAASLSPAPVR